MTEDPDDIVTLHGQDADGSAVEMEMSRWAADAARRGETPVYRSGDTDWQLLVDDEGNITRRLPFADS